MIARAALALMLAVAMPAHAADPRLVILPYRDNVVVRLSGHAGVQSAIAFGDDEHIENVAIGDANLWQVTPNKRTNILFVKPTAPRARTNLTVVTDQHSYFFDLAAAPGARATYLLRFTYPTPPKPPAPPPPLTADEKAVASGTPAAQPIDPAVLDFGWRMQGKPALLPTRVFSDGRDTYLAWPEKAALPAILAGDGKSGTNDEKLGPVNFATKGGILVVEGVPARLVLRAGKDSATIEHVVPQAKSTEAEP